MAHVGSKPDEKFVGNTQGDSLHGDIGCLKTARLGDVALDIDGKRLPPSYRSIFIGLADLDAYDRIMMAQFSAIRRRG